MPIKRFLSITYLGLCLLSPSLVYNRCAYIDIVAGLAEKSMQAAVDEVKGLPEYSANGEV